MLSTSIITESSKISYEFPPMIGSLGCDVAHASPFDPGFGNLHLPLLTAFGGGRLHCRRFSGSWDLKRAVSEKRDALVRSRRLPPTADNQHGWDDLTFQFGARAFVYADKKNVMSFACSPEEADCLAKEFADAYRLPHKPSVGSFLLIKYGSKGEVDCVRVPLPADSILSRETFELHYGEHVWGWHDQYVAKLRDSRSGLSILQGPPGTGKTSYLRHLMGELRETHRFYFIPAAAMDILSQPAFIDFWADQRARFDKQTFVVILEDSDSALMSRGPDNRGQVNAILNLSDGMLADFLRLQIICTINCATVDLDQALVRPGRLLCHRVFGRLDYACAARLAEKLGRVLPAASDYSLAEVYAGHGKQEVEHPRIGFAP